MGKPLHNSVCKMLKSLQVSQVFTSKRSRFVCCFKSSLPAATWLINVLHCFCKHHLFGNSLLINFSWGVISLETALRCHGAKHNKTNKHGRLPRVPLGIWHEKAPRRIRRCRRKAVRSEWFQIELRNFPVQLCLCLKTWTAFEPVPQIQACVWIFKTCLLL